MPTPSPKVIAAKWLLQSLDTNSQEQEDHEALVLNSHNLSELSDSRVNDAKVEKVVDQINKITLKLRERLEKVVEKFENKAKLRKPFKEKKKAVDLDDDDEVPKKKKKKNR